MKKINSQVPHTLLAIALVEETSSLGYLCVEEYLNMHEVLDTVFFLVAREMTILKVMSLALVWE